jgi:hypothetical protein
MEIFFLKNIFNVNTLQSTQAKIDFLVNQNIIKYSGIKKKLIFCLKFFLIGVKPIISKYIDKYIEFLLNHEKFFKNLNIFLSALLAICLSYFEYGVFTRFFVDYENFMYKLYKWINNLSS